MKLLYETHNHLPDLEHKERESAHAFIYNKSLAKFLVFEEVDNPYAKTKYSLLGGKLEQNESIEQALMREINEESGIDLSLFFDKKYLGTRKLRYIYEPQHINYTLTDYIYLIFTSSKKSEFYADKCITRWLNPDEISKEFNNIMVMEMLNILVSHNQLD